MKKLIFSAFIATALFVSSCGKDDDNGGGSGASLPGTLYVDFATDEIKTEIHHHINHTGIDTSIVEDTQKEIEELKKTIDNEELTMNNE